MDTPLFNRSLGDLLEEAKLFQQEKPRFENLRARVNDWGMGEYLDFDQIEEPLSHQNGSLLTPLTTSPESVESPSEPQKTQQTPAGSELYDFGIVSPRDSPGFSLNLDSMSEVACEGFEKIAASSHSISSAPPVSRLSTQLAAQQHQQHQQHQQPQPLPHLPHTIAPEMMMSSLPTSGMSMPIQGMPMMAGSLPQYGQTPNGGYFSRPSTAALERANAGGFVGSVPGSVVGSVPGSVAGSIPSSAVGSPTPMSIPFRPSYMDDFETVPELFENTPPHLPRKLSSTSVSSLGAAGSLTAGRSRPLTRSSSTVDTSKMRRRGADAKLACTNCHTKTTPLWRRNAEGEPLCNACGLFLKLHGEVRPLSLKTDVIKKRNRSIANGNRRENMAKSVENIRALSPQTARTSQKLVPIAPKPLDGNGAPAVSTSAPVANAPHDYQWDWLKMG